MPRRYRVIIPLIMVVGAVAGMLWLDGRGARTGLESSSRSPAIEARKALPPSAVLAIDVSRASSSPGSQGHAARPPSLKVEFDTARNLKSLYDALSGPNAPGTAEANLVRYEILLTCAARTDKQEASSVRRTWSAERRKSIADSIAPGDPLRQRRLDAFDRMAGRCDGLESVTTTGAALDALLDAAAKGGDPVARVLGMQRELLPDGRTVGTGRISESQVRELQDVVASRDPIAIYAAGTLLSNTFVNEVVRVNGEELDGAMAFEAWRLVACDYGMECGPESRTVDALCATNGWCGARNIADLTYFYDATPNNAQLVDRYRQVFRQVVESGDWTPVQTTFGPSPYRHGYYERPWFPH